MCVGGLGLACVGASGCVCGGGLDMLGVWLGSEARIRGRSVCDVWLWGSPPPPPAVFVGFAFKAGPFFS